MDEDRDNVVEITRRRPASGAGSIPPARDSNPPATFDADGHVNAELLASWVDDPEEREQLPVEQRQAVEAHLAGCVVCQTTLAELETIVMALAALPQLATPRSFALTPEQVAVQPANLRETAGRPVVLTESRPWYARQLAALRWATAVAAILFVMVVSADIVSRNPASSGDDSANLSVLKAQEDGLVPASGGAAAGDSDTSEQQTTASDSAASGAGEGQSENAAAPTEAAEPEQAQQDLADETASDMTVMLVPDAVTPAPGDASGGGADAETEATQADDTTASAYNATPTTEEYAARNSGDAATEDGSTDLTLAAPVDDIATPSNGTFDQHEEPDSTWRLLQVGLALVIIWLLVAMLALPRLRQRSRDGSE